MFQDLIVNITGTKSIYIENYKNILDYKDDMILIQGKKENLKIRGQDFIIDYFTNESMRIKGSVSSMEFYGTKKASDRR